MTLAFHNPSRSFDPVRNVVLFSGHDGMREVRFLVEAGALSRSGTTSSMSATMLEEKCLSAFDALRSSIYDVAREAYSRGRRNFYTLTASDFR